MNTTNNVQGDYTDKQKEFIEVVQSMEGVSNFQIVQLEDSLRLQFTRADMQFDIGIWPTEQWQKSIYASDNKQLKIDQWKTYHHRNIVVWCNLKDVDGFNRDRSAIWKIETTPDCTPQDVKQAVEDMLNNVSPNNWSTPLDKVKYVGVLTYYNTDFTEVYWDGLTKEHVYTYPELVKYIKVTQVVTDDGQKKIIAPQPLMPYTEQMREELCQEISSLPDITDLQWKGLPGALEEQTTLFFVRGKNKFMIHASLNPKLRQSDEQFPVLHDGYADYYTGNDDTYDEYTGWMIDANLGRYQPKEVLKVIEAVCQRQTEYHPLLQQVEKYANELQLAPFDEDVWAMSFHLAEEFMQTNNLQDDQYGSMFQMVLYICTIVLGHFAEQERWYTAYFRKKKKRKKNQRKQDRKKIQKQNRKEKSIKTD